MWKSHVVAVHHEIGKDLGEKAIKAGELVLQRVPAKAYSMTSSPGVHSPCYIKHAAHQQERRPSLPRTYIAAKNAAALLLCGSKVCAAILVAGAYQRLHCKGGTCINVITSKQAQMLHGHHIPVHPDHRSPR